MYCNAFSSVLTEVVAIKLQCMLRKLMAASKAAGESGHLEG
jgi:hypothetical protein